MIERIVIIDSVDPLTFYGVNNANLQLVKNLFPKLRISARGSVIRVIGEDSETAEFEKRMKELVAYAEQYNSLNEEAIISIVKGDAPKELKRDGVIIYGVNGKPIQARNANQEALVEAFNNNDLTFALGPAGTGKTYIAIALAVRALKNREARKIILSRPAVEAGEKLGFLPGDLQNKVDPYLRPLYDALFEMLGAENYQRFVERGNIEVAPLAYMRGRTLDDSFIILDEAQNTTPEQMKMFLTRLGFNSKAVINGDATQIDLPSIKKSGLVEAVKVLKDVEDISLIKFTEKDVVRHRLVQNIIKAYEKYYERAEKENGNRKSYHIKQTERH